MPALSTLIAFHSASRIFVLETKIFHTSKYSSFEKNLRQLNIFYPKRQDFFHNNLAFVVERACEALSSGIPVMRRMWICLSKPRRGQEDGQRGGASFL